MRPIKKNMLLLINILFCGIARACIKILPFPYIKPYLGTPYQNIMFSTLLTPKQHRYAIYLRQSIHRAAKLTPWHSNCLTQALVARLWCFWLDIPYVLYIGFQKDSTKSQGLGAHAWLTAGPIAITGGQAFPSYQVISSYISKAHQSG